MFSVIKSYFLKCSKTNHLQQTSKYFRTSNLGFVDWWLRNNVVFNIKAEITDLSDWKTKCNVFSRTF